MAEADEETSDSMQIIRGIPFPKSKRFIEKNIVEAMDYVPQDGDLIIASYPKTGTTWLQYIILQIISKAQLFPSMEEASHKLVPFLELVGVAALKFAPKPRIYKHHIPYNLVQKNKQSKCIYIYRNPEDTVVSYYKFIQSFNEDKPIDFLQFFERFLHGNIEFGSYFHHVKSFYNHQDDINLLLVSYEKLHSNTKEEILRIAKFLDEEHYQYLLNNQDILIQIIENTSFGSMRNKLQLTFPREQEGDESQVGDKQGKKHINFFRKGVVGDGKTVLLESQRQRVREMVETVMKGTDIAEEWLRS